MPRNQTYRALKERLNLLERQMGALKVQIAGDSGMKKIEACGSIIELERRHKELATKVAGLDQSHEGWWQKVKAEIYLEADDLTSAMEDLMAWADQGFLGAEQGSQNESRDTP